ncbi:MAG: hypothetical protein KAS32_22030 [Candidatus Peribacteraceae bacterium]|nr:hypothetical protein [Candidatus Peribacteraceae bacterium]
MGNAQSTGKAEVTIEAKVFRKDGSVEDLGVVSKTKVAKSLVAHLFKRKPKHGNSIN